MISCILGTRAQLIKMAPVLLALQKRNIPTELILTGQHKETMQELADNFGLTAPPKYLYKGPEISGIFSMLGWFTKLLIQAAIRSPFDKNSQMVLVHGDTLSTLLGALAAKFRKIPVAHIESGLRSHNIFHPFPEELTRIAVFNLCDIAYCPGEWAYQNMEKYHLTKINTHSNTLIDALSIAIKNSTNDAKPDEKTSYCVCSIHRFENIFFRKRLEFIVEQVITASKKTKVLFVLHPATRKQLIKNKLIKRLESNNIELLPRMGYIDFISLIRKAKFVITDGGGNQEELSYLNIPTILMRKTTERKEGIGSNVTISNYDPTLISSAIDMACTSTIKKTMDNLDYLPSDTIASHIADHIESKINGNTFQRKPASRL